jgi:hypothetical protein
MDFMTESFENNMINIEKSIEKFQYNLVQIRSDFLKQINAYYAIHMKMKINYEYVRSKMDEVIEKEQRFSSKSWSSMSESQR